MRLNIGILDDELEAINKLESMIHNISVSFPRYCFDIQTILNSKDLVYSSNKYPWDILFLDIELRNNFEGKNGLSIAKELRNSGFEGYIICTSSYPIYAIDGYEINAFRFLVKPVTHNKIISTLTDIFKAERNKYWNYQSDSTTKRIECNSIFYLTIFGHKCNIHKKDGVESIWSSLSNIEKTLPLQFIRCHRSYIVNIDHVDSFTKTEILLSNGEKIPISQKNYLAIENSFLTMQGLGI